MTKIFSRKFGTTKNGEIITAFEMQNENGMSVTVLDFGGTIQSVVPDKNGSPTDVAKHGKGGVRYPQNGGFCLDAQHYPDSVNHANFPNTVLRPNEVYTQKTIYKIK